MFEHGADWNLLEGDGAQSRFVRAREPSEHLAATIGRYVTASVANRLFRRYLSWFAMTRRAGA